LGVGASVAVVGDIEPMSQQFHVPQLGPHTVVATFAVHPVGHVIAPAAPWTMTIASIVIIAVVVWFAELAIVVHSLAPWQNR
jgi:hypothetical protein